MAQRYQGQFSPNSGGNTPPPVKPAKKPRIIGKTRAWFLFVAPLPMAIRAFFFEPSGMAITLAGFGTLILAAWLTREGLIAQAAYDQRKVARRPAIPRKIFGSVLTGVGLFLAGFAEARSLFDPLIIGGVGTVLHSLTFGFDPMKNKGMEGIDDFQTERVARVVDKGEKYLAEMADAIKRARNRRIETRVAQFSDTARDMFRTVENDPRDLTAARKYMGVYLKGARDATVKFADIYARNQDQQALADFDALLNDLQENFAARTEKLLVDDKTDLDIEIEVLRERLQREGIAMGN